MNSITPILAGKGLPQYEEITAEQIQESIPLLLKDLSKSFDSLEKEIQRNLDGEKVNLYWDNVMHPLQKIEERMRWSWGVVCHLNAVCNSDELRKVYSIQQPEIIRFSNRIGQSKQLYKALSFLINNNDENLNEIQTRIIKTELMSMKHRGVGLNGEEKAEFNKNSERLAGLSTQFGNNVLDATKEWSLLITDISQLEGIPERVLKVLANAARTSKNISLDSHSESKNSEGPWLIELDMPTYISIITYAKRRQLRETIYKAYVSRASDGKNNNTDLINEILSIRRSQAKLLGYRNWAELSLANKMAKDVNEVKALLEDLRSAAMIAAKEEMKQIQIIAAKHNSPEADDIQPWDISYWSEMIKKEKFKLDQESLRPWFPLPQVLDGLFKLSQRLFNITIKPASGNYSKWHDDVGYFDVIDSNGSKIASFFLDPYSRPKTKRGGAWMDECLTRDISNKQDVVLPIAYLICNQTPPAGEIPSLMSFEEVQTLFHEFGHGLQHMLTTVDYPQAAGINNVEWDAVELPSQFMENWCLDQTTINEIAKHWETGEALPKEEFEKLKLNKKFNTGMATLRQIHFALTDIKLHHEWTQDMGISPDKFRRQIAKSTTVTEPIPEDQFLCAFSHIFAGGYAAGYYSYKWAEVLSADAFSAFEEVGMENNVEIKNIGEKFRETILSLGGSQHPADIYKLFRGRPANTNALIRHSGLEPKS